MIRYILGVLTGAIVAALIFSTVADGMAKRMAEQRQLIDSYQADLDRW